MFHEQFKKNRKQKGWSQEQLAKKLNINRQTIQNWEAGIAMPDLEMVTKISDIFDTSIDDLLKNNKTDSDYRYYTVSEKPKKQMHEAKIIAMVILSLSVMTLLTLLVITFLKPLTYVGSMGRIYHGFMAYFLAYGEYSLAFVFSLIVFVISLVLLLLPEPKLKKLLQKKKP